MAIGDHYFLLCKISYDPIIVFGYDSILLYWNKGLIGIPNKEFISLIQWGKLKISYYIKDKVYKLKDSNGNIIVTCSSFSPLIRYTMLLVKSYRGSTNINYNSDPIHL